MLVGVVARSACQVLVGIVARSACQVLVDVGAHSACHVLALVSTQGAHQGQAESIACQALECEVLVRHRQPGRGCP